MGNELSTEKTMTTKELADYLNTSPKVVIENARKCLPEKIIENGKATLWTREEITIIIEQMKRSFNKPTFTESVKPVSTELTPALKIKQAMLLMQEGYEEELAIIKQRAEIAEQKCIEQRPKVEFFDAVADSKDAIDIGNVAKVLNNGTGRNRLFEILRNRHVLQNNNVPYQKYIDAGFFRVIEQKYGTPDGSVYVNIKTLVYQRGIDYIRKVVQMNQKEGK